MGLCLLLLLCVLRWQFSYVDLVSFETGVSRDINFINSFQYLQNFVDENSKIICARSEAWNLSTVCSDVQLCGKGLCKCCTDNKNRSYADCSGNASKYDELLTIPPLPFGVQVLKFSWRSLLSEDINQTFFDSVKDLTHLYLSNNNLKYIHRSMFEKLTKLECLNVNGNLYLQENPESLQEMLAIPGLQELSADSCFLLDNIQTPENSSVEYLYVRVSLVPSLYFDMTQLSSLLHLKSLLVTGSAFKFAFSNLPLQVETLDFQLSILVAFPKTCSDNGSSLFPQLESLYLDKNLIVDPQFMEYGLCLPKLTLLDMDFNIISTLQSKVFSSENFPSLQCLSMAKQNNMLFRPFCIREKAFSNPSLEKLYLTHNDIWFGRQDLVAADAFDNCTNLRLLYMDGNSLRDVDDDRFLALFGGLYSLQEFSLSGCQYEAVSTRTFQTLTNLTHLYLDGNLISHIPHKTFEPLQRLKLLDLSNNKLAFLSDQAFRNGFQYTLNLSLSRNPFICSCELIWLKELQKQSRHLVVAKLDFNSKTYEIDTLANYKCDNLKGFSVSNFSLARQACLLSEQTSIMITYTCSLLVVALTAFLLLFAYRWHFRLLLFEAFRGTGQARRLRLQQNKFNYDVFVSYASEDLPWVRRHLMPQLEERLGQRLCIHERDFILGHNIVDNIAECVESSKKILMVFSKSFVLSQWCQFELTHCLTHVLEYDDSLLIVCVDDVLSHEMTSAMMAVLKTTTYIQWAEEEYYATESFWGRIKIALQEIMDVGEHVV